MSDISHLIRLFDIDSEGRQWRKDMADRVRAQIALVQEERKDYKCRAEAAEARAVQAEQDAMQANNAVMQATQYAHNLEAERDELRRQLEQAQREITEQQAMIGSVVKAMTA